MEAIVEYLKIIPKDLLLSVVYQLMVDGKLSYHELMDLHVQNLKRMQKGETEAYFRLQAKVVNMWADNKKNLQKNLKETIQLLKDEGRVNINQDEIDKYFKEK
jgi:hypothetical protein